MRQVTEMVDVVFSHFSAAVLEKLEGIGGLPLADRALTQRQLRAAATAGVACLRF